MNTPQLCKWTFYKNSFMLSDKAELPVLSHIINFGTGVFEALRVYKTKKNCPLTVGLQDHMERLKLSIDLLGLSPLNIEKVQDALNVFVIKNKVEEGYIRIIAYPDGSSDTLDISSFSTNFVIFGWHINTDKSLSPISLYTSQIRRPNACATVPRAKVCGLYVIDVIAQNMAKTTGFDTALILNEDGTVCEAAGANLFIVKDSVLYTPFVRSSIKGITASFVTDIAVSLQLKVHAANITVRDLRAADEVFITGTYYGIRSVSSIGIDNGTDEIQLKNPQFTVTNRLVQKFREILDDDSLSLHQKWTKSFKKSLDRAKNISVSIRIANLEDSSFIKEGVKQLMMELRNESSTSEIHGFGEMYKDIISDPSLGRIFILVVNQQEKAGFVALSQQKALHCGGKYIIIQELWVKPKYRSCGGGAKLLQQVEKYSRSISVKRIEVGLPNTHFTEFSRTYNFYCNHYFKDVGVRLRKDLD